MKSLLSAKNESINLVVGAGFSGAVIAERIANALDEKVVIIDKNNYIGGLASDYMTRSGIRVNKFGHHVFHTDKKFIWDYVNSFSNFCPVSQKTFAVIDGIKVSIPVNISTLHILFPESLAKKMEYKLLNLFSYNSEVSVDELRKFNDTDLQFLADYISDKLVFPYSAKLWQDFMPEIERKQFPYAFIRISNDSRLYTTKYQGIPKKGYIDLMENMLKNHNIELCLNTDYNYMISKNFKRIFFTGSIDDCFNYKFGMLQYKSVKMQFENIENNTQQRKPLVKYPQDFDFSAEHNFVTNDAGISAKEYWTDYIYGENERAFPVLNKQNCELYNKYFDYAKSFNKIYFFGRQGNFNTCSMADAVEQALNLFDNLYGNSSSNYMVDSVVDNCR